MLTIIASWLCLIVLICRAIPPRENNSAILGTASGEMFPAFVADGDPFLHDELTSAKGQHDHG